MSTRSKKRKNINAKKLTPRGFAKWIDLYTGRNRKKQIIDASSEKFAADFSNAVNARIKTGLACDIYEYVYHSPKVARITFSFVARSNFEFAEQLLKNFRLSGKVLDIGCGHGFLSLYFGYCFPELNFVGIDTSKKAIRTANNLLKKLKLKNVKFRCTDLQDADSVRVLGKFDHVMALTVFREMDPDLFTDLIFDRDSQNSVRQALEIPYETGFRILRRLLRPGGTYIGAERAQNNLQICRWVSALQTAGLSVVPESITSISSNDQTPIPMLIAQNHPRGLNVKKLLARLEP